MIDYCICDNGEIIPEFLRKYNKEGANLVQVDTENLKGVRVIKADVSCIDGEYIRHDSDALAKQIIELICNELKYKDKQDDEQYILLNSKLKEQQKLSKKERKSAKLPRQKEKILKNRKRSKFREKYSDRIESIQNSDETRKENRKLQEEVNKITKAEKKKEKKRYIEETLKKKKK